jgi:DNA invertase Pin-like site-specific DNA recombinase
MLTGARIMSGHSTAVAFSYVRFSSPEQAKGDSLRRQTQKTADWCQRHGVALDNSITLRDLGVSAFKGRHRDDKYALGQFLKLVERGRVPKGSFLVIENLDRLSREDERKALRLWMDILDAGINIVQLTPETIFRHERSDMIDVMRAIIELSRGHSESVIKSERLANAWAERKRKGREEGAIVTERLPYWIELKDGELKLIPERAAVVKRVFQLAARGYGLGRIARLLTAEGVPAFGRSGIWCRAYIACLIGRDKRAMGEYQPRFKDGRPDGEPIKGYFPAAVTEAEWRAAQQGKAARKLVRKPAEAIQVETVARLKSEGESVAAIAKRLKLSRPRVYRLLARAGAHEIQDKGPRPVHLFSGLLTNARDGKPYYPATRISEGKPYKVVLASASAEKMGEPFSFSYAVVERAVLSLLKEVEPREILAGVNGHDEVVQLEQELGGIEAKLAKMQDLLEAMDAEEISPTFSKEIARLEKRQRELAPKLKEAQQKAANPLSGSWGETKTLLDTLESAPDPTDARLRLRSALRRIVESISLLVVPRGGAHGRMRLALLQVFFTGGACRTYLVFHERGTGGAVASRPSRWWSGSLAESGAALDLRKAEDVRELAEALEALDLSALNGPCPVGRAILLRLGIRAKGERVRELAFDMLFKGEQTT